MSTSRQKGSLSTASQHTLNQQPLPRPNKAVMSGAKPVGSGGYGLFDQDEDAPSSFSRSTSSIPVSKIATVKKTTTTTTSSTISRKPIDLSASSLRTADFSKSFSGIPTASSASSSSTLSRAAGVQSRSRLAAPRIKSSSAASRHSPYARASPRAAKPLPARPEDDPKFAPVNEVHKEKEQEQATPEKQILKTPPKPTTWSKLTGFFSTGRKPAADVPPQGGFLGKLLFSSKKTEEQEKEETDKNGKKKRYSLPGSFEDVEEKENREQPSPDADPYLNPYKQLGSAKKPNVSQSFSGTSSINRGMLTPSKRSIRGVASSFDESKTRTGRFHPYGRSLTPGASRRTTPFTPSRTATVSPDGEPLTEEERIKRQADEELRAIEQRKRDRYVQEQEDRYRLRAVAKKMGKKLEDIMDTSKDEDFDEEMPSSQETVAEEPAPKPVEERKKEETKKPERRGFGLFDDDEDEEMEEIEIPMPPPKSIRSPVKPASNRLPFSGFASSENVNTNISNIPSAADKSKSASPSPDSDKENLSIFNEPIGPMPPAPTPAHATLPPPKSQPVMPSPAKAAVPVQPLIKAKAQAEKHRPAIPSGLRASTRAASPDPMDMIRAELEAITDARLKSYNFPPVKNTGTQSMINDLNKVWNVQGGGFVDAFYAEFSVAV